MILDRIKALDLLHSYMESVNLRKHCYGVAATMKALANHFKEDELKWEIAGLLHDADYQKYPDKHPQVIIDELEKMGEDADLINAIRTHAYKYNGFNFAPETNFEWSLYCCDELTGLIVAVTLVRPEKKIELVTVENVMSKWNQKGFAAGVNREQIELCEEKLGIKLPDFIDITLKAMQGISKDLGL